MGWLSRNQRPTGASEAGDRPADAPAEEPTDAATETTSDTESDGAAHESSGPASDGASDATPETPGEKAPRDSSQVAADEPAEPPASPAAEDSSGVAADAPAAPVAEDSSAASAEMPATAPPVAPPPTEPPAPATPPAQAAPATPPAQAAPATPPAAPVPTPAAPPTAPTLPSPPSPQSPMGTYGPLVSVTRFDVAPPELEWQLPLNGELYRLMPGSDRPDYSLFVLERPLHFYPKAGFLISRVEPDQRVEDRKGRPMVRVHAMLLCARFVGQQLHPGMVDLAVNLAYVIDNSLARDAEVDFAKIEFAAVGYLSEGHAARPPAAEARAPEIGDILDEVGRQLHAGIELKRGAKVRKLTAALKVGPDHRLTGLSGNADGYAPVPMEATFSELNETLERLARFGHSGRVAAFTVHIDDGDISHEVTATHD